MDNNSSALKVFDAVPPIDTEEVEMENLHCVREIRCKENWLYLEYSIGIEQLRDIFSNNYLMSIILMDTINKKVTSHKVSQTPCKVIFCITALNSPITQRL